MNVDCRPYEQSGYRNKRDTSDANSGSNDTNPETNPNTNSLDSTKKGVCS